jgi:Zn finger protein HypA/HybF involved in hydrogenase expression
MVNGVYCHEQGCPDAWRNYTIDCWECGFEFQREERYQQVCGDCASDRTWHIQHGDDSTEEGVN